MRGGIRSGDVMDIESWSERCDEALKRGDDGMPSTTTWAAGFLLRKGQSREALGKWLTNRVVVVVFIDKQQDKSSWTPSYSQPPEWALDYSSLHQSRLG